MKDYNQDLTDKNIRDLLKWRLLEQVEDDVLTQKLTDMEAKLVFGTEAQLRPSLQKEKEFLLKLTAAKNNTAFFKWMFVAIFITIATALLFYFLSAPKPLTQVLTPQPAMSKGAIAVQPAAATPVTVQETLPPVQKTMLPLFAADSVAADTLKPLEDPNWVAASAGIKPEYVPVPHKPKFVDSDQAVPSLNEKEIEANNKLKEKMIKQLIKKDKNAWVYVPTGSDTFYGKVVSMQGFYMAATEVSNKQYRIFLNDLLINGRAEDYLKAVPDTGKWISGSKKLYEEAMRKNYFWHPAYDNYPVVCVPRAGAEMYCVWLTMAVNEKIKKDHEGSKDLNSMYMNDLRIPAESEWMMAARGGTVGNDDYPWSVKPEQKYIRNSKGCYLCNFSIVNYPDSLKKTSSCADAKQTNAITSAGSVSNEYFCTAPVSSYNPNVYGLYCMAGNAAEMVYKDNWEEQIKSGKYKPGKPAAKGGSWASDEEHVKIGAAAEFVDVTEGSPYIGFRPVFTAPVK